VLTGRPSQAAICLVLVPRALAINAVPITSVVSDPNPRVGVLVGRCV